MVCYDYIPKREGWWRLMGKNEWANAMIRENPYFVDVMTPEVYDKEREYYLRNYEKIRSGKLKYNPNDYKTRRN